jgi:hypothetical protein
MAPTRHETSGAGPPDNPDNKSTYGTRASKRKAVDISEDQSLNGETPTKTTSSVIPKKQKVSESKPTPVKKRTAGHRSKPSKFSSSTTPEDTQSSVSPDPEPAPEISLDDPSGTSSENPSRDPSPKKAWVEPEPIETELPPSIPSSPKKGGFRGRGSGRGGRGGRSGRGGRPPKGDASGRATPAPSNGIVRSGRGGGRGRAKKQTSPRLKAYSKRKDDLRQLYRNIAQQHRLALAVVAEKSISKATEDPNFHKDQPEYSNVMTALDKRRDEVILESLEKENLQLGVADREHKANIYIAQNIFDVSLKSFID